MTTSPVVLRARGSFRTEVEAGPYRWVLDELASALGGCTATTQAEIRIDEVLRGAAP